MNILEQLPKWATPPTVSLSLPTEVQVNDLEKFVGCKFPISYKDYLLHYSNLSVGTFELFSLVPDEFAFDIYQGIQEAREMGVPMKLFPFLYDNDYYYCFNLQTSDDTIDYEVVVWCNGLTGEKWANFLDWVENCWLYETKLHQS
jgi:hypothetical protein